MLLHRPLHRLMPWLLLGLFVARPAVAASLGGYWTFDPARSESWPEQAELTAAAAEQTGAFDPARHDPASVCMPFGMPRVMTALAAQPMEIVQTPDQITLLFDAHDEIRRIFLNRRGGKERPPSWLGHSTGYWESDTLVVQTSHVNDATLLTEHGIPHGADLQVTERFTLIDEGRTLRNEMTLVDPASLKSPVTRRLYYRATPESPPVEFACSEWLWHENVMRRAKQLTRDLGGEEMQP